MNIHTHNISWMNVWIQNYKWMNNLSLFSSVFWGSTTESTMICVSMEYFTICIINEQIFKWYRDKYFFHRSGAPKYMYYIQRRFVHLAPHLKQKEKKKICNKNKFFFYCIHHIKQCWNIEGGVGRKKISPNEQPPGNKLSPNEIYSKNVPLSLNNFFFSLIFIFSLIQAAGGVLCFTFLCFFVPFIFIFFSFQRHTQIAMEMSNLILYSKNQDNACNHWERGMRFPNKNIHDNRAL